MNASARSLADISAAEAAFFKRRRIARVASLVWPLLVLGGITLFGTAHWPTLAEWCLWLALVALPPVTALYVWSARCTVCGGGITLDGRTCARCGHAFSPPAQDEVAEDSGPSCPHCLTPIEETAHFCPRCEKPLTGFAATDPIKSILTEGQLYRGATHTTRPSVVVGMWLLCVPTLIISVVFLSEPRAGLAEKLVSMILVFAFYGIMLYRVTTSYLRARKKVLSLHKAAS